MTYRTAERIVTWALVATAACSSDRATGPGAATCSSALASQLTLAIGAYTSIDPASDGGCVTFPANTSVDSAEYLLVAQSAAGTFGQTAPFSLRTATLQATATPLAQRLVEPASPRATAIRFDGMLRVLGHTRSFAAATAMRSAPAAAAQRALVAPAPPVVGSVRTFAVCASLDCTTFKNVSARARAVGAHVAIYIDTLAPAGGLDSVHLDTLRQVFDTLLYPLDSTTFGAVTDLDTNGVVIALMTPVVNALRRPPAPARALSRGSSTRETWICRPLSAVPITARSSTRSSPIRPRPSAARTRAARWTASPPVHSSTSCST